MDSVPDRRRIFGGGALGRIKRECYRVQCCQGLGNGTRRQKKWSESPDISRLCVMCNCNSVICMLVYLNVCTFSSRDWRPANWRG